MKENRHSDPSLSAERSKVASASSVASVSHGKVISMKLKKSDLVWGGDGQDAKVALHGSPEAEASWKKNLGTNVVSHLGRTKRSTPPGSPSSGEACSPLPRKKKRAKRIHLMPVVKRSCPPWTPPSNTDALSRKKHIIKRVVVVRVTTKRSSRPKSPSSNTDDEGQSTGDVSASLSRKRKISKRVLDIGQLNADIALCHSPINETLLAQDFTAPNQLINNSMGKPDGVKTANKLEPPMDHSHALVVDYCLGALSEESTWTQEKTADIPIPATEEKVPTDHKQEQGPDELQNLLDLDEESIMTKTLFLIGKFNNDNVLVFRSTYDEKQQVEVYHRLSRYYIKDLKLPSPGEEPLDAQRNKELEPLHVYEQIFLQRVNEDPEWYFHPEHCKLAGLDDYQRLVLCYDPMYGDWDGYRRTYHTYREDLEYVKFREEISEKIKWIEDEAALMGDQQRRNELVASYQSLNIALQFCNISGRAAISGFREHIDGLRFDFNCRKESKDLVGLYLVLWKQVAKKKVNFGDALRQLYEDNIFPCRKFLIKCALDNPDTSLIKYNYDTYVDGTDEKLMEDEARPLIIEAVNKMLMKRMNYLDYTRKKLAIAAHIGLIPRGKLRH